MSNSDSPAKDAPAPFASVGDDSFHTTHPSDFILRSSDGFDFHVHKDILKFASGCFEGMFFVSTGAHTEDTVLRDGKSVVTLAEPKDVLYQVLCLGYPLKTFPQPQFGEDDLECFVAAYRAAQKYQFTLVEELLKARLGELGLVEKYPLRVFAISRLCGWPNLAKKAVYAALKVNADLLQVNFPEMHLLTWADGQKVVDLCRFYRQSIRRVLEYSLPHKRPNPDKTPGHIYFRPTLPTGEPLSEVLDIRLYSWLPVIPACIGLPRITPVWHFQSVQHSVGCSSIFSKVSESFTQTWFSNHIERLNAPGKSPLPHKPHSTKQVVCDIPSDVRAIIEKCSLCRRPADEHLRLFATMLVERLDGFNVYFEKYMSLLLD